MTQKMTQVSTPWMLFILISLVASLGCSINQPQSQIVPMEGSSAANLDAGVILTTMRRAGFSDAEIIELGPKVRNAVAANGGARILEGETEKAAIVVQQDYLCVSREDGLHFTQPLNIIRDDTRMPNLQYESIPADIASGQPQQRIGQSTLKNTH